jgi:hypothetical protein
MRLKSLQWSSHQNMLRCRIIGLCGLAVLPVIQNHLKSILAKIIYNMKYFKNKDRKTDELIEHKIAFSDLHKDLKHVRKKTFTYLLCTIVGVIENIFVLFPILLFGLYISQLFTPR